MKTKLAQFVPVHSDSPFDGGIGPTADSPFDGGIGPTADSPFDGGIGPTR